MAFLIDTGERLSWERNGMCATLSGSGEYLGTCIEISYWQLGVQCWHGSPEPVVSDYCKTSTRLLNKDCVEL